MFAVYKRDLRAFYTTPIGYVSVSYTHLDVYKRQALSRIAAPL